MRLSVVIPTKNDEQNGRLATVLNLMAPLPIEILVVDWGSEVPVEVPDNVRLVRVPPEIAKRYDGDSYFAFATATNVGIRRAIGDYIAFFGNDTFCDWTLVDWCQTAKPDTFYLIARKNIDGLGGWDKVPVSKMTPQLHASGAQIAHRDLWHALRGYDQRLVYYGWMDHESRVRAEMGGFKVEAVYDAWVYHFKHPRSRMRQAGKVNERVFPDSVIQPTTVAVNDENWGLWDEPLALAWRACERVPA